RGGGGQDVPARGRPAGGARRVRAARRPAGAPALRLVSAGDFAGGAAGAVGVVVLPHDRAIRGRGAGVLGAARGRLGGAVLLAVHRVIRRLHGGVPLGAHRHPAGAAGGLHRVQRDAAGGDAALLPALPAPQGDPAALPPPRFVGDLRGAGVLPAAAAVGLPAGALAVPPPG